MTRTLRRARCTDAVALAGHWHRPLPGRADRPAPAHRPPVLRRSPKQSGRQSHTEWGANLSSPTPSDENCGLDANRREEVVAEQGRGELVERPLAPFPLTDALWIVTATDPGGISEPVRKRLAVIEPLGYSTKESSTSHNGDPLTRPFAGRSPTSWWRAIRRDTGDRRWSRRRGSEVGGQLQSTCAATARWWSWRCPTTRVVSSSKRQASTRELFHPYAGPALPDAN